MLSSAWMNRINLVMLLLGLFALLTASTAGRGETFRVATYNLESYLDAAVPGRSIKSAQSRQKICESILKIKPDVLAMQELGSTSALLELRDSLKTAGLDLPHWEYL